MHRISTAGLDFIKRWESFVPYPYDDMLPMVDGHYREWTGGPVYGTLTIGYGHTDAAKHPLKIEPGLRITEAQASEILDVDLDECEDEVNRAVKVALRQGEYDALVSFTFNIGSGAFENSSLLSKLNKGDYDGARAVFDLYVKSKGQTLLGLQRRRDGEQELWDRPDDAPATPAPKPAPVPPPKPGKSLLQLIVDLLTWLFTRKSEAPQPAPPADKPLDLAGRIVRAMKLRGYRLDAGAGEMNTIYVEGMGPDGDKNNNAPNEFNDARFVLTHADGKWKLAGAWQATTEPSRIWTMNPMNPKGAARIKFGQYTAWQVGSHHGHEALVQTGGPVTVCRDLNKDFKRIGDKEDTGHFGINQHWGYDLPKNDLGNSSAGCLVGRMKKGHQEFMALMKSDPRYVDDDRFVFTAAIIPASEI